MKTIKNILNETVLVDETAHFNGLKGNDVILTPGNEFSNSNFFVIAGTEERLGSINRFWLRKTDSDKHTWISVNASLVLIERPGLKYKVGDRISIDGREAEVLVINPETNEYYISSPNSENDVTHARKTWWPEAYKLDIPHGYWLSEKEINQSQKKSIEIKPEPKTEELLQSVIEVPGIPANLRDKLPAWTTELMLKYKAGIAHLFVLWGNINDLQKNLKGEYLTLYKYLAEMFEQKDFVMFYSLSSGLQFADEEMEKKFRSRYLQVNSPATGKSPSEKAAFGLQKTKSEKAPISELIGERPDQVFKFLEKVLTAKGDDSPRSVLIVDFAHNVIPDNAGNNNSGDRISAEILERWAKDFRIRDVGNAIVLLTPLLTNLAAGLRSSHSEALAIRIPKPGEEARVDYWKTCINSNGVVIEDDLTPEILGRLTSGVSRKQIGEIYALAKTESLPLNFTSIKKEKRRILQQEFGDKIRFEEPRCGFGGFGGEEHIKEMLTEIQSYIFKGIFRRVPMGMLVIGPPGTGKTELLRCWAYECGYNFVSHKNPRGMYVGESENAMLNFLASIDDASPIIVVEDEADQSESPRDSFNGDNGVSNRLRQMKFDFCSDEKRRGKVIWVRISNRPDLIDPAYKRDGRTDYTFAMLPPFSDANKLRQIFEVMPGRENIPMAFSDFRVPSELAAQKIHCTGASVRKIMMLADIKAGKEDLQVVEERHVIEAVNDWTIAPQLAREIDTQTIIAIESSDVRPDGWEKILDDTKIRLYGEQSRLPESSVFHGLDCKARNKN
jgi:transitional endoplasmic reticulum ATPase